MVNVTIQSNTVSVSGTQVTVTSSPSVSNVVTGEGAKSLVDLSDVDLTGKIDKSLLVYNQSTGLFSTASGDTVPSVADGGDF